MSSTAALEPPLRPQRRRSDRAEVRITRDRLVSMAVLAALLHGLVILGITFAPPPQAEGEVDQGIEVLLVSEELPESLRNDSAIYLSQRTQTGSGNTEERERAQVPQPGQPASEAPAPRPTDPALAEDQVLAANAAQGMTQIQALPLSDATETPGSAAEEARKATEEALKLRGQRRDELYVTADTRASRLAPYLDAWRRRVERVGTINYPSAAQRQGMTGNPVIEVAIGRDGKLQSAKIVKSSGHAEIDAASLDILRLASPFDPFPPELAADYRVMRFAYEWQFTGGRIGQTSISTP
jgi:periplasmic protein TonB